MFHTHWTAANTSIFVCQMTDAHLRNTIRLIARQMADCLESIKSAETISNLPAAKALLDYSTHVDVENAKKLYKNLEGRLSPYVVEAATRNLNVSEFLQSAYGRADGKAIPVVRKLPILPKAEELEIIDGNQEEDPYLDLRVSQNDSYGYQREDDTDLQYGGSN